MKYKTIVKRAKQIKSNVKRKYRLGKSSKYSYYFAKSILNPKQSIKKVNFTKARNSNGDYVSTQIGKDDYLKLAKKLVKFVEENKRLPNHLTWNGKKLKVEMYTYLFARIVVYYYKHNKFSSKANLNSKVFIEPSEPYDEVYNYFVKTFGKFDNTIDGALSLIDGRGYGAYANDRYTNKESINRMKKKQGVNCTDSCHVFYNIMLHLIKLGKYKKVECLHVDCSSGGHVKLRITLKDGSKIIRDPACALSDNGKGYKCNWCTNSPKAIDPAWFMENLNR